MVSPSRQYRLARAFPFYYGWFILGITSLTSYSARPLMAATTLSIFVVPMTEHFGWSRGVFSGALSLGGLCAVVISPFVGRWIDRYGSGVVLSATAAIIGLCGVGLAFVSHLWVFYALYVPGRAVFASPLELATSTATSNWFIRRRPLALAVLGATQGTGLAAMPVLAQAIISSWGWQAAWASLGIYTLAIGVIPALLIVRRPEDMGLEADPSREPSLSSVRRYSGRPGVRNTGNEPEFTVGQALATRSFWVLAGFSAVGFLVQGGVIVHMVPHYVSQGLPGSSAALIISAFALAQVAAGLAWSVLTYRFPVRFLLAGSGLFVALGAAGIAVSGTMGWGLAAAGALGVGIGGAHLLLRTTWADFFGRGSLGSIRGITLSFQLGGQLVGPVIAGFTYDAVGSYRPAFLALAAAVSLASVVVLAATPPRRPLPGATG